MLILALTQLYWNVGNVDQIHFKRLGMKYVRVIAAL